MHVLTLLWRAFSACRPLKAANCTANHMYSNKKNTSKMKSNLFAVRLRVNSFASVLTCCWSRAELHLLDARAQQSCDFHSRAPSVPARVREGAAAGAEQKLTGGQARQIGQVERRGNHKPVRNAQSAHANFSPATTPLFLWGPDVLQIASACRIIVVSAQSCLVKPKKTANLLWSTWTCKAGKIFARIYLHLFHFSTC